MINETHQVFVVSREADPLDLVNEMNQRLLDLNALALAGTAGNLHEMAPSYLADYFWAMERKVDEVRQLLELYDEKLRPRFLDQAGGDFEAAEMAKAIAKLGPREREYLRSVLQILPTRES